MKEIEKITNNLIPMVVEQSSKEKKPTTKKAKSKPAVKKTKKVSKK